MWWTFDVTARKMYVIVSWCYMEMIFISYHRCQKLILLFVFCSGELLYWEGVRFSLAF